MHSLENQIDSVGNIRLDRSHRGWSKGLMGKTTRTFVRWTVALVILIVIVIVANAVARSGWVADWVAHAVTHLSVAGVAGFLFTATVRLHRGPLLKGKHWWKIRPVAVVSGLGFMSLGQLVEALSAYTERAGAGILHDASGVAMVLASGVIFVGVVHWVLTGVWGQRSHRWVVHVATIFAIVVFAVYVLLVVGLLPLG